MVDEDASPGQLLQLQREQQGLSRAQLAERLHLGEPMLAALENDEYQRFVSVSYAIGHLRSYARLLSLDDDELVQRFYRKNPSLKPHAEPMTVHRARQRARQVSGTDRPILFVNWLIGLIILLLVILWYRENYVLTAGDSDGVLSPPASASLLGAPDLDQPPAATNSPIQAPDDALAETADDEALTGDTLAETADDEALTDDTLAETADDEALADDTLAETADDEALAVPGREADETPAPAADDTGNTGQLSPDTSGAPANTLQLALVGGESWVEIQDASEENLFFRLAPDGLEQTLYGQPPFRVVIGHTPPVQLYYRGQRVDLEAHTGPSGTARFTLE